MKTEHETRDADTGSLFLIIGLLALSGVIILLGVWVLMRSLSIREAAQQSRSSIPQVTGAFPQPMLETRSGADLQKIRTNEEARLNSYGWIDRNAGIAHIPIERAMEIILARGLPDVGHGQTPLQLMQSRPQQDGR
jgi:hypothetical protein